MKRVYLIAGHHNNDSGAISDGYKENEWTKKVRDGIKYFLKKHYPELTVLTDDDSKTLSQVIKWIKDTEGSNSLVYDIHLNSASNNTATGVECFIADNHSKKSELMAKGVNKVIVDITGLKDRGVKTESSSKRGTLGILHTKSPAVIIELGFINNPLDREKLTKNSGWIDEQLAHEIAKQAKS